MRVVSIVKSYQGYTLKKPYRLQMSNPINPFEEKIQQYIIDSFIGKMPHLAQFALDNKSIQGLASHLLLHSSGSKSTLYNCVYAVNAFSTWLQETPDRFVNTYTNNEDAESQIEISRLKHSLDSYVTYLLVERKFARKTIHNMLKYVELFLKINNIPIRLPYRLKIWPLFEARAPTIEELQKVLKIANLRHKVIVSSLATGGFRVGTLAKLKYRHVKKDLERSVFPIHVHVEGEITKSKYHDFDTFLSLETSEFLRTFIEMRRQGTYFEGQTHFPPESISDETPLVGFGAIRKKPITAETISDIVHDLFVKAELIGATKGQLGHDSPTIRYDLRAVSLRKFFRSQLAFLGVERDFIEYMMGHKVSSYFDVKARGIDHLRSIYLKSGFSIMPQTKEQKIQAIKEIARCWGINPQDIVNSNPGMKPCAVNDQ